jgi:hypothetical protein
MGLFLLQKKWIKSDYTTLKEEICNILQERNVCVVVLKLLCYDEREVKVQIMLNVNLIR